MEREEGREGGRKLTQKIRDKPGVDWTWGRRRRGKKSLSLSLSLFLSNGYESACCPVCMVDDALEGRQGSPRRRRRRERESMVG